ncbi:MAG: ribonuclease III [candidate division Zixibacteria bacterium]|nr:ribonuclease III [candidate division Zixibacteria bacterium]
MGFFGRIRAYFRSVESAEYNPDLDEFQILIGYRFVKENLLHLCLSHRSFSHQDNRGQKSNERLEFLGDSVLGLVIAELLYRDHPEAREGELTKKKALLVNETTLASIGRKIRLNNFIRLSEEEDRSGGRQRPSIIADAFESVIGAVFLDGGVDAARDVVFRLIYAHKRDIITDESQRNFKGELLEYIQSRGDGMPHYTVASEEGPDHRKVFNVEVYIGSEKYGVGSGYSKKEAEQKAAAEALNKINPSAS